MLLPSHSSCFVAVLFTPCRFPFVVPRAPWRTAPGLDDCCLVQLTAWRDDSERIKRERKSKYEWRFSLVRLWYSLRRAVASPAGCCFSSLVWRPGCARASLARVRGLALPRSLSFLVHLCARLQARRQGAGAAAPRERAGAAEAGPGHAGRHRGESSGYGDVRLRSCIELTSVAGHALLVCCSCACDCLTQRNVLPAPHAYASLCDVFTRQARQRAEERLRREDAERHRARLAQEEAAVRIALPELLGSVLAMLFSAKLLLSELACFVTCLPLVYGCCVHAGVVACLSFGLLAE